MNYLYTAWLDGELITVGNTHHEVNGHIEGFLNHNPLAKLSSIEVERYPFAIHPRWFDNAYFEKKREEAWR